VPVPKHHIQSWGYDDRHKSAVAFPVATTACSTCLNAITTISWMHRDSTWGSFFASSTCEMSEDSKIYQPSKIFWEMDGHQLRYFTAKSLEFVTTHLKEHINKPQVRMKSVKSVAINGWQWTQNQLPGNISPHCQLLSITLSFRQNRLNKKICCETSTFSNIVRPFSASSLSISRLTTA
jgi:hypothetical protein